MRDRTWGELSLQQTLAVLCQLVSDDSLGDAEGSRLDLLPWSLGAVGRD